MRGDRCAVAAVLLLGAIHACPTPGTVRAAAAEAPDLGSGTQDAGVADVAAPPDSHGPDSQARPDGATVPAPPDAAIEVLAPAVRPPPAEVVHVRAYASPAFLLAITEAGASGWSLRTGGGVLISRWDPAGFASTRLRVGLTVYVLSIDAVCESCFPQRETEFGVGGELVLDRPLPHGLRWGVRAAAETGNQGTNVIFPAHSPIAGFEGGALLTVGARLWLVDALFAELDFYHLTAWPENWTTSTGSMLGLGVDL